MKLLFFVVSLSLTVQLVMHQFLPEITIGIPHQTLRVYIYGLPNRFNIDLVHENPSCQSSMFASEIRIHEFLMHSGVRTMDAAEADFFFIPVYSSCALTMKRVGGKWINPHTFQRQIVQTALQYLNSSHQLLERHQGKLLVVLSHDFGACLWHRSKDRFPLLKGVIAISPLGDPSSNCFDRNDVVVPPFTDTNWLSSSLMEKSRLAFFRGTVEWNWMGKPDRSYSRGVRQKLFECYRNSSEIIVYDTPIDDAIYRHEMAQSVFCLCPPGYANWSPRLVHAIVSGCIPVLIGSNILPFPSIINWTECTVQILPMEICNIHSILKSITADQIHNFQVKLKKIKTLLFYSNEAFPNAFHGILQTLINRV